MTSPLKSTAARLIGLSEKAKVWKQSSLVMTPQMTKDWLCMVVDQNLKHSTFTGETHFVLEGDESVENGWHVIAVTGCGPDGHSNSTFIASIPDAIQCIRDLLAENERQIKMLADCFRMAGSDSDGDEDWRIASVALMAVTDLRRAYDEAGAENERLEKDAARYRYLFSDESFEVRQWVPGEADSQWIFTSKLEADKAIDAASQACGACGDGCAERGRCKLKDESPDAAIDSSLSGEKS